MAWSTKVIPNDGWNSGARTIAYLMADGLVEFEVGQAVGIVCGLNDVDNDAGYLELDHAFLIETRKVTVIEGGIKKISPLTFSEGVTFGIEREGSQVRYYVAGSLLYTSTIPSAGPVFLDCSLYAAGDTILEARITDYFSSSGIILRRLTAFGTDFTDDYGLVVLSGLEVANDVSIDIALNPLATSGGDGNYGFINLLPLTVTNDPLIPDSSYAYLTLSPLALQEAADVVAEGVVTLKPIAAFGTEVDGIGFAALKPLTISAATALDNVFLIDLPFFTDYQYYNDTQFTIPAPLLSIAGTVHTSRVEFIIPAPTISAYGGGITTFTIPSPTLAIAGTTQQLARVEFEIPAPELAMTALVGDTGRVAFTLPAPTLKAYSGGRVAFPLPAPVVTVAGTTEILARVALSIPSPVVAVAGEVYGLARVAFEIPAPILAVGRGNWVEFEIPAPLVVVSATYVGTTTQAAEEVTYAVNLNTGAVTQLLLGGFDKLVTAHGRLYGLKDGALTRLEGNVDGTETLIPATIRFAANTFDTNNVKRISNVYWSTRESDGITMDLIADERTVWRYQTTTDTAPAFGTHKIKTGLGVVFHTAGIVLRNRNGGTLDIGGGEFIVHPLSRKPR